MTFFHHCYKPKVVQYNLVDEMGGGGGDTFLCSACSAPCSVKFGKNKVEYLTTEQWTLGFPSHLKQKI